MKAFFLAAVLGLVTTGASAADNLVSPSCWQPFAPRPANAPRSSKSLRAGDAELTLASAGQSFVYGGWRCRVEGIAGGSYYQLQAEALPAGIELVRESVTVLLRWKGDFGSEVAPSYVWQWRCVEALKSGLVFERCIQAPAKATAVEVELVLQWSPRCQPLLLDRGQLVGAMRLDNGEPQVTVGDTLALCAQAQTTGVSADLVLIPPVQWEAVSGAENVDLQIGRAADSADGCPFEHPVSTVS